MAKIIEMSKLKKGDYFSFEGKKKIYKLEPSWRRGHYCYVPIDDVWGGGFTTPKTSKRKVFIADY